MIVTTAHLYKEYADFIAHKNEKFGSDGQIDAVCASVKSSARRGERIEDHKRDACATVLAIETRDFHS